MTRFSNDSFQLHGVINGVNQSAAATFRCLQNITHSPNIATTGPTTGAPYNEIRFVETRQPELTTSIAAIGSLLDLVSLLTGGCITSDETRPGVRAFMQSHNPCAPSARTAGANHQRVTIAKAHLVITQIGGQRGQTAYAAVRVIEESTDGQAEPDLVVYNAALPSTFIFDEEYMIWPPVIGGVAIAPDHIVGWQIETGIEIEAIIAAGSIFITAVDITKIAPRITIEHDDTSLWDAGKIPADGLECDHADTSFGLQKRSPFGGMVDPEEEEHVLITAAGYAYHSRRYDASGSAVGSGEITIECTEGTGGVPLAVSTGVALNGS